MELTDIMSVAQWTELEEELYHLYGLNVRVYDRDGTHITPHEGWANRLCPLIRSTREGLMSICSIAHQNAANQARKSKAAFMSECDAGLIKFVVPIFGGEEFLGTIGGCGLRLPDVSVETFLIQQITGYKPEDLAEPAADVKTIAEEKTKQVMDYFQERLNTCLEKASHNTG